MSAPALGPADIEIRLEAFTRTDVRVNAARVSPNYNERFMHSILLIPDTRILDDSDCSGHTLYMGRPKQFDERIQLTMVEGTTGRIDGLLEDGEYRLDFIRTAIEAEIKKRTSGREGSSKAWRMLKGSSKT